MSKTDKNGNMPEVGGFVEDTKGNRARIVSIIGGLVFNSHWHSVSAFEADSYINVGVTEIAKLLDQGYTFLPKPEEPEKEAPIGGTLVNIWAQDIPKSIRVSAGRFDHGGLECYEDGQYGGRTEFWTHWEVIK